MATNLPKSTAQNVRDLRKNNPSEKLPRTPRASKKTETSKPTATPTSQSTSEITDISGTIRNAANIVRNGIITETPNYSAWKVTNYQTNSSAIGETALSEGKAILEAIERKAMTAAIVKANQGLQTDLNIAASDAGKLLQAASNAASSLEGVNTGLAKYQQNVEKTQLENAKAENIKIEAQGTSQLAQGIRALQSAKHQKLMSQVQAIEAQAARYLSAPVTQTIDAETVDI